MNHVRNQRHSLWLAALLLGAGCASSQVEKPLPHAKIKADTIQEAPEVVVSIDCRLPLSGELTVNEILSRPAGIDLDGDGISNTHDEAVELIYQGEATAHLDGTELWLGGQFRGIVTTQACVQPGDLLVLTGPNTLPLAKAEGVVQIGLDHALQLTDGGGLLLFRSAKGALLGSQVVPPASATTPTSLAHEQDDERDGPMKPHVIIGETRGAAHSIGRCLDGALPCHCVALQSPRCDREEPTPQADSPTPVTG